MKIAILISGHTRNYEETLSQLILLKEKFNADMFISSYSDRGTGVRFWQGQKQQNSKLSTDDINVIKTSLSPIHSIFTEDSESPKRFIDRHYQNNLVNVDQSYNMLDKIWEVNQFKLIHEQKNNFKYDLVIRTRFDLNYRKIDLYNFEPGVIFGARADIKKYATDTFLVTDSSTFDKICLIKEKFGTQIHPENFYNTEHLLTHWIESLKLKIYFGNIEVRLRDKVFN